MFRERKSAQIAAWFLDQAGGRMSHLKLLKLMYLAEREAMAEAGSPMTGDRFVAMPYGPVLSRTLDHITGNLKPTPDGWDTWISALENHEVARAARPPEDSVLDELSPADRDVLNRTWDRFGSMDKWQLVDYTHEHCPEWVDPNGSSFTIPAVQIFEALGKPHDVAQQLAEELAEQEALDQVFANL